VVIFPIFGQPPSGYHVEDLEQFLPEPRNITENHTFNSVASFTEYLKRFASQESVIFADEDRRLFLAIIDYHSSINAAKPEWCKHQIRYSCTLSREWKKWTDSNGKNIEQSVFAEFLEDRAQDIVSPDGSELLEMALKFKVIRQAEFGSAIRLNTGEFQFQYNEENQRGTIELPEMITIALSPFHNGAKYEVKARLRYRLKEGNLTLSYHLINPERFVEDAFREVITSIKTEIDDISIYEGSR
jgi:uncharacterized protein YfdQ (DUF2303 family)